MTGVSFLFLSSRTRRRQVYWDPLFVRVKSRFHSAVVSATAETTHNVSFRSTKLLLYNERAVLCVCIYLFWKEKRFFFFLFFGGFSIPQNQPSPPVYQKWPCWPHTSPHSCILHPAEFFRFLYTVYIYRPRWSSWRDVSSNLYLLCVCVCVPWKDWNESIIRVGIIDQ